MRKKPTNVVFRVTHPEAGEGFAYMDEREAYRHIRDASEPIPYAQVKGHISGAWANADYVTSKAATDFKGDAKRVVTFSEWKGSL